MGKTTEDSLSRRLIGLLERDARMSVTALARELGVARSTVQNRLRELERDGVIEGYTVRLSSRWAGRPLRAHVLMSVSPRRQAAVEHALARLETVRTVYSVSGEYDLVAVVHAATPEALDAGLDEIRSIDGVERTTSSIILATRIAR